MGENKVKHTINGLVFANLFNYNTFNMLHLFCMLHYKYDFLYGGFFFLFGVVSEIHFDFDFC